MRRLTMILLLAAGCAHTQLSDAKRDIMSADYRADIAALERLRDALPHDGYVAQYWRGYADWRIALNGASKKMPAAELQKHLENAAAGFDQSVRLQPDFADAYAAGGSVNGWLAMFHRGDTDAMRALIQKSASMLKRALELAPDNPRALWVKGGDYLFKPPQFGGDKVRAIETYKRALAAAEAERVQDAALPDWGKPESLMALAFANLNSEPPDLPAARKYAEAALHEVPYWWYVREVLTQQIADAMAK